MLLYILLLFVNLNAFSGSFVASQDVYIANSFGSNNKWYGFGIHLKGTKNKGYTGPQVEAAFKTEFVPNMFDDFDGGHPRQKVNAGYKKVSLQVLVGMNFKHSGSIISLSILCGLLGRDGDSAPLYTARWRGITGLPSKELVLSHSIVAGGLLRCGIEFLMKRGKVVYVPSINADVSIEHFSYDVLRDKAVIVGVGGGDAPISFEGPFRNSGINIGYVVSAAIPLIFIICKIRLGLKITTGLKRNLITTYNDLGINNVYKSFSSEYIFFKISLYVNGVTPFDKAMFDKDLL